MEQIYMIEILIDRLSILVSGDETDVNTEMGFILKVNFGPKREMFFKEDILYDAKFDNNDDCYVDPEDGLRKWTRTFRLGKTFLFPACPDTFLQALVNFPLKMELWTDDEFETSELVAEGAMNWDPKFFFKLKETLDPAALHSPLALKQRGTLKLECCCKNIAIVTFYLRLSTLGTTVTTEFQHLYEGYSDPEVFVFRNNKYPTMIECRRFEGEDPNFLMIGPLYESVTLDDPDFTGLRTIEVCTNLRNCGTSTNETCHSMLGMKAPKEYPIQTIRMGDICGPCGNTNCDLAHKIKGYIRTLEAYKKEANAKNIGTKPSSAKVSRICGQCGCIDETQHRATCPAATEEEKPICEGCGGVAFSGETCEDRVKKCSENNPKIAFMTDIIYDNKLNEGIFKQDFTIYPCEVKFDYKPPPPPQGKPCTCKAQQGCGKAAGTESNPNKNEIRQTRTMASNYTATVYNAEARAESTKKICTDIPDEKDKDCKCKPPVPAPPCKTTNCECMIKAEEEDSRKVHRPFCPCYKHRPNCPVTTMNDDEEEGEGEIMRDVEEPEPLPYGLPPVQLGPCPVLGRPCTVPDGFARMYKTAALPTQPASWSEAGKVCCSKEFERIKKALKEYVSEHKKDDFRCVNKFYVDTERRCCDKEQRLLSLLGKSCCGSHKIAIQDTYKLKNEREESLKKSAEQANK